MTSASLTACPARLLPPGSRQKRDAVFVRHLDGRVDILDCFREKDAVRHDLINAGVCAAERPVVRVRSKITRYVILKVIESVGERCRLGHGAWEDQCNGNAQGGGTEPGIDPTSCAMY